jgi:hypothetical protein
MNVYVDPQRQTLADSRVLEVLFLVQSSCLHVYYVISKPLHR